MMVAGLVSCIVMAGGADGLPSLIDAPIANYYSRALAANTSGEPQKALGMLKLLLIPRGTLVRADYDSLPAGVRPRFEQGVERGLQVWREALGGDFPFRLAPPGSAEASVTLGFVEGFSRSSDHRGEIDAKRRVQWNHQVHYIEFSATISVAKTDFSGEYLSERDVAHIVAHEIGHALGLADTREPSCIMGPLMIGQAWGRLADREVAAVLAFREAVRAQIDRIAAAAKAAPKRPAA